MSEGSPAADRFWSCWQKLDRAREHADDLDKEISDFWATGPLDMEYVTDCPAGITQARITRLSSVPARIPMIAGDTAHNIRSALDHFAWAAASPASRGRKTAFPTAARAPVDRGTWHKQVEDQLKGASAGLIVAVSELEPWEGGQHESLWAVHELDRIDKHRLFLSAVVALNRIELHGDSYELTVVKKYSGFRLDGPLPVEPLQWTPVKDKSIIKIPMTGPEFGGTETGLVFNLEIAEVECLRRIPVAAAMTTLANSVEDIIRRLAPLA